ncbi:uncharacterized protein LOC135212634 [Macrobrachium nipponense]|uniref:uncharacterized protein LOC135212634 n=1 Tax=Macrobrachium nipponense TaxID=159736 RepID=UPI0030C86B14
MTPSFVVISIVMCLLASSTHAALRITQHTMSTSSDITFEEDPGPANRSTELGTMHSGSDTKNFQGPGVQVESDVKHGPVIFTTQEKHVIYGTQTGRLVLAGVMGACIGLFSGFLLTVVGCCCYLRLSHRYGTLEFDKHNNTYRSADLIDGVV